MNSDAVLEQDISHLAAVWGRVTDLVIERGEGCFVYADDGKRYLDFTSGIGVTNTGHCHPRVVGAIQEQAARIMHAQVNCYFHTALIRLGEALNRVTPEHLDTFFFSNSGAEAVEGSVKLARHATGRTNIIVFEGSFHGRTSQTMAMTTSKTVYRVGYQPLPGGIFVAPFPDPYRHRMTVDDVSAWALRELDRLLHSQTAPEETAAVVIEPVLGEGGYVPAPAQFLKGLRRLCDEHGILLVMDEIQSGFGRTGRFFAHEYAGIEADILVMAKGMGSGFPISGIASTREIMGKWKRGAHGGTYGGNPMGCAAAEATIGVLLDEGLVDNAAERGRELIEGLRKIQTRFPVLGDVRGLGLMVGCEFADPDTGEPDGELANTIVRHAREQGRLLLLTCGTYGNVVRWIPPLVVTHDQVADALDTFEKAVEASVPS